MSGSVHRRVIKIPLVSEWHRAICLTAQSSANGGIALDLVGSRNDREERRNRIREFTRRVMLLGLRQGKGMGINRHFINLSIKRIIDAAASHCSNDERRDGV